MIICFNKTRRKSIYLFLFVFVFVLFAWQEFSIFFLRTDDLHTYKLSKPKSTKNQRKLKYFIFLLVHFLSIFYKYSILMIFDLSDIYRERDNKSYNVLSTGFDKL